MSGANDSSHPRYRVVLIGLAKEEFLALVRLASEGENPND